MQYADRTIRYEAGGAAFHSGAAVLPVIPSNSEKALYPARIIIINEFYLEHHLTLQDVKDNIIISEDGHLYAARPFRARRTAHAQ